MAITNPNLISGGTIGIESQVTLDGTTTYVEWSIPPRVGVISLSIKLAAETGHSYKVEYTNSPVANVQAGTAQYFDYFGADQSVSKIIPLYGCVSAVKISRVSSTTGFICAIRGQ